MAKPRSRRRPASGGSVPGRKAGAPPPAQPAPTRKLRFGLGAVPAPARYLGLAGLIPFVALAAAVHLAPEPSAAEARRALAIYGAVILSFMGGARWGLASAGLGEGPSWWRLSVSVTPALLAFAALATGTEAALWACALGLVALFAADAALTSAGGAPAWWPALRLPLSVGAALCLLAGALG